MRSEGEDEDDFVLALQKMYRQLGLYEKAIKLLESVEEDEASPNHHLCETKNT